MIRVVNHHTAAVAGIAPGAEGEVDETNPGVRVALRTGRHLQPAGGAPVVPELVTLPRTEMARLAADFDRAARAADDATERAQTAESQLAALRAGVTATGESLVTLPRADHDRLVADLAAGADATDAARAAQAAAERALAEARAEIERLRAAPPPTPATGSTEGAAAPDATESKNASGKAGKSAGK